MDLKNVMLHLRWICAVSRHHFNLRTLCCTALQGCCSSVGEALLQWNRDYQFNTLCMHFSTCQLSHHESNLQRWYEGYSCSDDVLPAGDYQDLLSLFMDLMYHTCVPGF